MVSRHLGYLSVLSTLFVCAAASCGTGADETSPTPTPTASATPTPNPATFSYIKTQVLPNCGGPTCHGINLPADQQIRTYDDLINVEAAAGTACAGQKRIVIGKGGEKLKLIGQEARRDIEALLGRKVMLRLWVKVKPGWTNNQGALKRMGYE